MVRFVQLSAQNHLITCGDDLADTLGAGSTQASGDPASLGKDQKFWDSLNSNVKNLHVVVSGHGTLTLISFKQ
jgi:hypothetical protein